MAMHQVYINESGEKKNYTERPCAAHAAPARMQ
jgi:hypothetical protein